MAKTIAEWFLELPEEIADRAVANTESHLLKTPEPSLCMALKRGFLWYKSKEGNDYWYEISERYK